MSACRAPRQADSRRGRRQPRPPRPDCAPPGLQRSGDEHVVSGTQRLLPAGPSSSHSIAVVERQ
eukprot:8704935-Lingulodinium_polyedra.AAC.1